MSRVRPACAPRAEPRARSPGADARGHQGAGLIGLAERRAAFSRDVTGQALPGGQFTVQARLPLAQPAPAPMPAQSAP